MDQYIFLVEDHDNTFILISSSSYTNDGSIVEYFGGNIGRVQDCQFFNSAQIELLKGSVDIYPCERIYVPIKEK